MPRQITFIHAADLHIGAPFRGLRALSEEWGAELVEAIPRAYRRVVDYALEKRVDFVVIAGDVFDMAHPSYADYRVFVEGLKKLDRANIPVYMVPGNHDPYVTWERGFGALPANAVMLSDMGPGYALYERDGVPMCLMAGRGYYNQSFPVDECVSDGITRQEAKNHLGLQDADVPFAVGVLHTGLETDTVAAKAPVSMKRLMASDMDYWALGHIHARFSYPENNPRICFSGIPQGRDIKETGARGVNLVTLTEGAPNQVEFLPCAIVVWQNTEVDITSCEVLADVEHEVLQKLFTLNAQSYCEKMCARVTLVGATPLHEVLRRPGVLEDVRAAVNESYQSFFVDAILDDTRMPRNYDALRAGDLFPAAVLDAADDVVESRQGMAAFLEEEFAARGLALPAQVARDVEGLAAEARDDILDLLEREAR